jgi:hypothetical protein
MEISLRSCEVSYHKYAGNHCHLILQALDQFPSLGRCHVKLMTRHKPSRHSHYMRHLSSTVILQRGDDQVIGRPVCKHIHLLEIFWISKLGLNRFLPTIDAWSGYQPFPSLAIYDPLTTILSDKSTSSPFNFLPMHNTAVSSYDTSSTTSPGSIDRSRWILCIRERILPTPPQRQDTTLCIRERIFLAFLKR